MVVVTTDNASGTGAGFIHVVDPVTWTSDTSLTLNAAAGININAAITGGQGSRLALRSASGNINQTAPISVVTLSARADAGSVNLTNAGNQVQQSGRFRQRGQRIQLPQQQYVPDDWRGRPENGITSLGSGPVNINASGTLMLFSPVSSQAGDIVLASAGTLDIQQSTVSSTSGRVTVQGIVLQPSLADCIANPAAAAAPQCCQPYWPASQTRPFPAARSCCRHPWLHRRRWTPASPPRPQAAAPRCCRRWLMHQRTRYRRLLCGTDLGSMHQRTMIAGCSVVLPTLAQCTSVPTTAGCFVVLPPVSQCVAAPGKPGLHRRTGAGPEQYQRARGPGRQRRSPSSTPASAASTPAPAASTPAASRSCPSRSLHQPPAHRAARRRPKTTNDKKDDTRRMTPRRMTSSPWPKKTTRPKKCIATNRG